jgi:hypothetical protein
MPSGHQKRRGGLFRGKSSNLQAKRAVPKGPSSSSDGFRTLSGVGDGQWAELSVSPTRVRMNFQYLCSVVYVALYFTIDELGVLWWLATLRRRWPELSVSGSSSSPMKSWATQGLVTMLTHQGPLPQGFGRTESPGRGWLGE